MLGSSFPQKLPGDQLFGNLYRVKGGTFAQIVSDAPKPQPIGNGGILA